MVWFLAFLLVVLPLVDLAMVRYDGVGLEKPLSRLEVDLRDSSNLLFRFKGKRESLIKALLFDIVETTIN